MNRRTAAAVLIVILGVLTARQRADDSWPAFDPKPDPFTPSSAFDLRSLNEKQAGDGGVIAARGSHFVHSATGQPVRFWAVNGPPQNLSGDELRDCARMLAKHGVNLVRIHGAYYDRDGTLDPARVRHTLEVVEAMKEQGIYSHLSIYFPLWLDPKPGNTFLPGYDGKQHPFAALYFNKDFQARYRDWWKAVLLTPDEKTGRRLLDDPAVFGLEIINEDSYFFWTFTDKNVPDPELRIVEGLFADWAGQKYGSLDAAMKHWNGQKTPRDNPAENRLGFRPLYNIFSQKSARDKDTAAFLLENQRAFYKDIYDFLRGLGFKGLITASNWATASPAVFGPLEKYSYTATDFLDRHGYFECNHKGDNAAWSIRNGHTWSDRSALRFDPEALGKPKLFVHPVMEVHYDDKPSMISETTFTRPNRYRSEAPLYYAAYGALQDGDAVVHFALDGARWSVKPNYWMQQWTVMSPSQMAQFPAAALIYRKGLVSAGETLVDLNLNLADLLELKGTPMPQDAALDELRLKDVPLATELKADTLIDPLVHYVGRTDVHFTRESKPSKLADLSNYIDRKGQSVTSITGQLKLDYARGVLRINAPAAQGASGNLNAAGPVTLNDLTISSDMDLLHIVAVSLDEQPLASSRKVLLQVMSEETPTGFQSVPTDNPAVRRITNIGRDPWRIKPISGGVKFTRADAAKLQVTPLDGNGYAQKRQAGHADDIRLEPATVYYLVAP